MIVIDNLDPDDLVDGGFTHIRKKRGHRPAVRCIRGHLFSEHGRLLKRRGKMVRFCHQCRLIKQQEYRAKLAADERYSLPELRARLEKAERKVALIRYAIAKKIQRPKVKP